MSSRRKGRSLAVQGLYQMDLVEVPLEDVLKFKWYDKKISSDERDYATFLMKGVVEDWESLDNQISKHSLKREMERISVVNRCILRLSIFSFLKEPFLPPQVVIDEALELTREFEAEESVQFINGVLDAILKMEIQKSNEV